MRKLNLLYVTLGIIILVLAVSSLLLLQKNKSLEATVRLQSNDIADIEKSLTFEEKQGEYSSHLESEYRDRLIDLQTFIGSPDKIGYDLPYDTNDCRDKFSELNKCVYMDLSYYENNSCQIYNRVIVTENGAEPASPKYKKALDDCKAIYRRTFEAWNPNN